MAAFPLKLLLLATLMGFSTNLFCDPVHETHAEVTDHELHQKSPEHKEQAGHSCPDGSDDATSCRLHCHAAHALFWIPDPQLIFYAPLPPSSMPLYHAPLAEDLSAELLRPPAFLRLS